MKVKKKTEPALVSLFSGCGGMDLGFKNAGYDIVWANDFDIDAQRVYRHNIGEIDGRDITKIKESEIPDCDILNAGFPCQPFSNAGNRKGVDDYRGNLYKECVRIINVKMPKVVVFENVRGILSTKTKDGKSLIQEIISELANLGRGYDVEYHLVNSSDFGVPQNRYRVIIIGIRRDLNKKFIFPNRIPKYKLEVGNILNIDKNIKNQVHWELSPQAKKMIQHIKEGGSWKDIPYELLPERFKKIRDNMKLYRSPNFYRRFSRNEINGTITASAQPENCGIIHPILDRRYTIREIAKIQSFPDDFEFFDSSIRDITAMYKVIGNAVPPQLAYIFAKTIKEQIFNI